MKLPLISVLICTYNAEETIKNTLNSCLNQTYKNFEILIHDDQSKDKTIEIINNIGDERIKIIESGKKLGPYKGLNFLLDNAKGKYIAIQDHDDIRHPKKLEEQVHYLENHKKYVGCGTNYLNYYNLDKSGFVYEHKELDVNYGIAHTSLLFRNEGYRYDTRNDFMCDQYFLKYVLTKRKQLIHIIPKTLTLHYIKSNGQNYSNLWFKYKIKNIKRYLDIVGYKIKSIIFIIFLSKFKWTNNIVRKITLMPYEKQTKQELIKDDYCKEMLSYLK